MQCPLLMLGLIADTGSPETQRSTNQLPEQHACPPSSFNKSSSQTASARSNSLGSLSISTPPRKQENVTAPPPCRRRTLSSPCSKCRPRPSKRANSILPGVPCAIYTICYVRPVPAPLTVFSRSEAHHGKPYCTLRQRGSPLGEIEQSAWQCPMEHLTLFLQEVLATRACVSLRCMFLARPAAVAARTATRRRRRRCFDT